jgi:hypothetical protein
MENLSIYEHVIRRHRPKGWRVFHTAARNEKAEKIRVLKGNYPHQADIALADPNRRVIRAPYVVDLFTLQTLLHEYGHVHLKHWGVGAATRHREEFEAERWAMEMMRIEGFPVTDDIKRGVRRYIRFCIKEDEAKGLAIEPHIRRFANLRAKKS